MSLLFMQTVNQSTFAQNLSTLMNQLSEDHIPLLITRDAAEPAVLVSWSDFRALEEAASFMTTIVHRQNIPNQGSTGQPLDIKALKGCVSYKGPPVSLADMDVAIAMNAGTDA